MLFIIIQKGYPSILEQAIKTFPAFNVPTERLPGSHQQSQYKVTLVISTNPNAIPPLILAFDCIQGSEAVNHKSEVALTALVILIPRSVTLGGEIE